jgi:phage terminase large subunit-like protein
MLKFSNRQEANAFYRDVLWQAQHDSCVDLVMRRLVFNDLFFLLTKILNRKDIDHDWLFERCRDVQHNPNNHLDLWAREHRKSTIITYGLTIQDVLYDPELTVGFFSVTRPLAKDFLAQIKTEFTNNQVLKDLFPDVLWQNPEKESPSWSVDNGIRLKRKSNPREETIEAYGLVEGLPTGKHFNIRVYDDVIDEKLVTNPEIIKKVTERWELSLNLGSDQIVKRYGVPNIARYIGTRYHYNDPYAAILKREAAIPRIHPATDTGKADGSPVYFSYELLADKRKQMGSYVFACQMLQDPKADEVQGFNEQDLMYWNPQGWGSMNKYILVDPASEKKKASDYTFMLVVGLAADRNYYILAGAWDRMNLAERAKWLFKLHRDYAPIKGVGYEHYGMQADIEHMKSKMETDNYRFGITPLGGNLAKNDRIRRLIPLVEENRLYLPNRCVFVTYERKAIDITMELVRQFVDFPVADHDDGPDCLARILDVDLMAEFPKPQNKEGRSAGHINKVQTDYDLYA